MIEVLDLAPARSFQSNLHSSLEASIHPNMRIHRDLLPLLLLGLVASSIVEASGRQEVSTTSALPSPETGVVPSTSTPDLGSSKRKDGEMNIGIIRSSSSPSFSPLKVRIM